jgi:heme exporter protein D
MGPGARHRRTQIKKDEAMNWKSFDDFWHMGGYGLYVWGSYGVTFLVMATEAHLCRKRLKAARRAINNLDSST